MKIIIAALFLFGMSPAFAYTTFTEAIFKKQKEKESVRWTLGDWMTQKKTFAAMDHWLAMNRSMTMFEINLEGGKSKYDLKLNGSTTEHEVDRLSASFYWSIFGLQYTQEKSNEDWERQSGQFNLRIFGTSSQTTNLVGFYGLSKTEYSDPARELEQSYYGGRLAIYILSFLGIDGEYRKNAREKDDSETTYEGERVEYGAFIDFLFFRIYGTQYIEKTYTQASGGTPEKSERDGTEIGLKIYF